MPNLLLLNFNGARYGVWEGDVPSVINALPLHRLPLSPPVIAGIAVIEDRSAVIADLGACLGFPHLAGQGEGAFLIINAADKLAGFFVEGKVDAYECLPEHVLPLPPAVATLVADTCAIRGASLLPIINVRHLQDRLMQGLLDLPSLEQGLPANACGLSDQHSVRVLSVGGTRFCVNAGDSAYAALGEDGIAPLPVRSRRLAGVALYDNAAVPVMLPETILGCRKPAERKGMLLVGKQGSRYGVAVDQDLGTVEGGDLAMLALPKLASKPWLPAAAREKGKLCLFVDCNVFAAPEDPSADSGQKAVFTPSSRFPEQFRKSDCAIVEFALLGKQHAVPQEEMKDDLPLLPFIPVPLTSEIVLGVAEHRGELLPVLDLAALFGRRTPIRNTSRMMHIVNGDFQALVITAEVSGSRLLPVEMQRQVPIALPHHVLYGCYLDDGMVRLILNVEALAVHFEKIAVRELVASLSPKVMGSAAFEEEIATIAPIEHSPVASFGSEEIPDDSLVAGDETAEQEQARQRINEEKLRAEEETASRAVEQQRLLAEAEAKAIEEKQKQETVEKLRLESEALARAEAEAREQEESHRKAAEKAAKQAEDLARHAAAVAAKQAVEEAEQQRAAEEAKRRSAEEALARTEEAARKQEQETALQQAVVAARIRTEAAEQEAAEQARIMAAAEAAKREAEKAQQQEKDDAEVRSGREALAKSRMLLEQTAEPKFTAELLAGDVRPAARERGKYFGVATVVASLMMLVIYLVSMPDQRKPQESLLEKAETQALVQKSAPQPEKEPPLFLTVPANKTMPATLVYTVVKGDNLWNIAKRFTGDAFSYLRVARDNSIATPDLIFPGQRIQLLQQTNSSNGPQGASLSAD